MNNQLNLRILARPLMAQQKQQLIIFPNQKNQQQKQQRRDCTRNFFSNIAKMTAIKSITSTGCYYTTSSTSRGLLFSCKKHNTNYQHTNFSEIQRSFKNTLSDATNTEDDGKKYNNNNNDNFDDDDELNVTLSETNREAEYDRIKKAKTMFDSEEVDDENDDNSDNNEDGIIDRIEYTEEIRINLPDLGETKGRIQKWFKKEGDIVRPTDQLCDIQTEVCLLFVVCIFILILVYIYSTDHVKSREISFSTLLIPYQLLSAFSTYNLNSIL